MMTGTATWLKQSVTIYPYSSLNNYGEYAFGAGVATACRIEQFDKQIIDDSGNLITPSAKITVAGTVTVTMKDKIVLPNGDDRLVARVDSTAGPDGTAYLKVLYV